MPTTANLPDLKPFVYLALSGFNLFGFYTNICNLPMTFYLYALLLNEWFIYLSYYVIREYFILFFLEYFDLFFVIKKQ